MSISFSLIFEKSYAEINQNYNEYYQDMAHLFCESVVNEISAFNQHAIAFGTASRYGASRGGIFYEGTEKMTTNAYYWWEAARDLVEYGEEVRWDLIGVYYYDKKDYALAKKEFEKALSKEITTLPDVKNINKYLKKINRKLR